MDPFELPEWLGLTEVTWVTEGGIRTGHHVRGRLTSDDARAEGGLGCDLLAVDVAHPAPVVDEATRTASHAAWRLGEVSLVTVDTVLTLAVPGTHFSADGVLEALARLARAVGADPECYRVVLRIGTPGGSGPGDRG